MSIMRCLLPRPCSAGPVWISSHLLFATLPPIMLHAILLSRNGPHDDAQASCRPPSARTPLLTAASLQERHGTTTGAAAGPGTAGGAPLQRGAAAAAAAQSRMHPRMLRLLYCTVCAALCCIGAALRLRAIYCSASTPPATLSRSVCGDRPDPGFPTGVEPGLCIPWSAQAAAVCLRYRACGLGGLDMDSDRETKSLAMS